MNTPRPAGDANALRDATVDHAAATLTLVDLARVAGAAQWESPLGPSRERNDVAHRRQDVPRPTEDTATDERRLAVRAGYLGAVEALRSATSELRRATSRLDTSLIPYAGTVTV